MNKVWLVTGSASGLGRNIAEAVLESGDRLVATARDTKRLDDLVKKYGDRVRAVPLDVTDDSAAQAMPQSKSGCLRSLLNINALVSHAANFSRGLNPALDANRTNISKLN
jgi:NADP-dependent 3-hydroxy acid dehydrogenase YdfG